VERQKEMRAQRLRNARQPANGHRRVLGGRFFISKVFLVFQKTLNIIVSNIS
jgi:hypothetical protein